MEVEVEVVAGWGASLMSGSSPGPPLSSHVYPASSSGEARGGTTHSHQHQHQQGKETLFTIIYIYIYNIQYRYDMIWFDIVHNTMIQFEYFLYYKENGLFL